MKKTEKGYLTVEATISLTTFLFFMMFLMNFGQIYQVQTYMLHGLAQTGKNLAFSSYEYKNETMVSKVENIAQFVLEKLKLPIPQKGSIKLRWKGEDYPQAVKQTFQYCVGKNAQNLDSTLKSLGLSQGIQSIKFSDTKKEGDDLHIKASYKVDLIFPFFGIQSIELNHQMVCRLWESSE